MSSRRLQADSKPAARLAIGVLVAALGVWPFAIAGGQETRLSVGPNILVSGDLADHPHVEPILTANPEDPLHLLGASINLRRSSSDTFVSFDGGETWRRTVHRECSSDPWVAFGVEGIAYFACLGDWDFGREKRNSATLVSQSQDGGIHWTGPVPVPLGEGSNTDRPAIVVDTTPGVHRGRVYVATGQWSPKQWYGRAFFAPSLAYSIDRGESFSDPVFLLHDNLDQQPLDLEILSDGMLLILFGDYISPDGFLRHRRMWTTTSADGGLSLTVPSLVKEQVLDETPFQIAVDGSPERTDRIYAVVDNSGFIFRRRGPFLRSSPQPDGIYLMHSDNKGVSWSKPARVSHGRDGSYQEIPTVAVNQRGVVAIAWYDTRNDSSGSCFDIYLSASLDGGQTFLPEKRVTEETSCPPARLGHRWPFGGDYSGLAARSDHSFQPFWADARTGMYHIWTANVQVDTD